MDNPCVRQDQAYQSDAEKVARQLVDDPDLTLPRSRQAGKIVLADSLQGKIVQGGNTLRKRSGLKSRFLQFSQFAGAMNLRMAGKNLLDQRAAGTWHTDHEDRNRRRLACFSPLQQSSVEYGG